MDVREVHYYAVPNGQNTNYYRLKVRAQTKLGDAEYRSGWFPGHAVDSLFGDVTQAGRTKALEARSKLEDDILLEIIATNKAWLEEASKHNADPENLKGLLEARRRVLAYPRGVGPPYPGTLEIQYNPAKGIAALHSDEKLVFVLSSNPNEVVGKIANFAQNEKTVMSINQLGKVIAQRVRNETAELEAVEQVNKNVDLLLREQISLALEGLDVLNEKETVEKKQGAIGQIDTLLNLIEAVYP